MYCYYNYDGILCNALICEMDDNITGIIILIGILSCRLYFHAHYVGDVLGGVALAVIWMMLFLAIYPLFYIRNKQ